MLQILVTILLSATRFAMTFPLVVLQYKFSYFETIFWTNIGGIAGIFFFAYLSDRFVRWLKKRFRSKKLSEKDTAKKKKIFSRKNRRIVRIKQKYGLIGIAATTPIILSIPVGVFLVVRYYPRAKGRFLLLIAANIAWSFLYTSFYMYWNDFFFSS